jgi:hypothetical protein
VFSVDADVGEEGGVTMRDRQGGRKDAGMGGLRAGHY